MEILIHDIHFTLILFCKLNKISFFIFIFKVSSTSNFKTTKCYFECAEAFDPSNVENSENRGIGSYLDPGPAPPGGVSASYCASKFRRKIKRISL